MSHPYHYSRGLTAVYRRGLHHGPLSGGRGADNIVNQLRRDTQHWSADKNSQKERFGKSAT